MILPWLYLCLVCDVLVVISDSYLTTVFAGYHDIIIVILYNTPLKSFSQDVTAIKSVKVMTLLSISRANFNLIVFSSLSLPTP